jgi:hypothetical protein
LRSWRVDAGADQQEQIDKKDGDEHEAADEDVGTESEDGFVFGKVRGWDVFVLVVAFVVVFGHADQLTLQNAAKGCLRQIILLSRELRCDGYGQFRRDLCLWIEETRGGVGVVLGRDCLVLPGFEEDDGGEKDNDQGKTSGDNDRQKARIAFAFFRGGIAG